MWVCELHFLACETSLNIPEHPWVPVFCYVMTEQPTDAGVGELANTLAADDLIKMVSA